MTRDYGVPQLDKYELAQEFPRVRVTRCRTCKVWNGHEPLCPDNEDDIAAEDAVDDRLNTEVEDAEDEEFDSLFDEEDD